MNKIESSAGTRIFLSNVMFIDETRLSVTKYLRMHIDTNTRFSSNAYLHLIAAILFTKEMDDPITHNNRGYYA